MEGVKNFTNIDIEDFEGMYGGEKRLIKKGRTVPLPETLANHFASQLATKILIRKGKDYLGDPERPELIKQIVGEIVLSGEKPPAKKPEKEKEEKETSETEGEEGGEFADLPPEGKPKEKDQGKPEKEKDKK